MRSRDKKLKWLAIAKTLADMGAGLGTGGPGGAWGQNLQGSISNLAASIEQEKAEEEAKKKKHGFGRILGVLGGTVGNAIAPGIGGAIGGALGSAAGDVVGGGGVDWGNVVSSGIGGYMGGSGLKEQFAPQTQTVPVTPAPPPPSYIAASPDKSGDFGLGRFQDRLIPNATAPVGTGTVLAPPPPQTTTIQGPRMGFGKRFEAAAMPTFRANAMLQQMTQGYEGGGGVYGNMTAPYAPASRYVYRPQDDFFDAF